jgi:hypothetical protein
MNSLGNIGMYTESGMNVSSWNVMQRTNRDAQRTIVSMSKNSGP